MMCCTFEAKLKSGKMVKVLAQDMGEIDKDAPTKGYRTKFLIEGEWIISDFIPSNSTNSTNCVVDRMKCDAHNVGIDFDTITNLETVDCELVNGGPA